MYFDDFSAALQMSGHGGFVWTAYLVTTLVVLLLLTAPRRRQRRFLRQLAGELKRTHGGPNTTEEGS